MKRGTHSGSEGDAMLQRHLSPPNAGVLLPVEYVRGSVEETSMKSKIKKLAKPTR